MIQRDRESRRERKRQKEEEIEKNTLSRTKTEWRQKLVSVSHRQTLIIPPYHLPSCHPGESIVNILYCFCWSASVIKPLKLSDVSHLARHQQNTKHQDATSSGASIALTNALLCLFCPFFLPFTPQTSTTQKKISGSQKHIFFHWEFCMTSKPFCDTFN